MKSALTLLLTVTALLARAVDTALPSAAQDAYAKGEYAQALHLYDSIAIGQVSAALYFNIGNCHMKLGDIPHAVLNYERAIRLEPGAEDIQANLDYARSKVVDRVNELPALTLGSLWDQWRGGKDVDQWARRSLWACIIAALLAAGWLVVRQRALRRVFLVAALAMSLATVIAAVLAATRVAEVNDRSQAIITAPKVDVRGEPRDGATIVFVLHEGTKVTVLNDQGGWHEVKLSNGSVGWAAPGSLEVI